MRKANGVTGQYRSVKTGSYSTVLSFRRRDVHVGRMCWRFSHRVVCVLPGPLLRKWHCTLNRSLMASHFKKRWFYSQGQMSSGEGNEDKLSSNHLVRNQTKQIFQPGLFHINMSLPEPIKQVNKVNATKTGGEQSRKRSYINYGMHLDPVIFRQLPQGWVLEKNGSKKEIFHPKLTPRHFYREADEYSETAVIYPQVARADMGEDIHTMNAKIFPDQFHLGTGTGKEDLKQLLESFLKCSDDVLLGLADDNRFADLTEFLGHQCSELGTNEFVKVLVLFARVQIRTSTLALRLFETECEKRYPDWNVHTSLLVCDAWRLIGLKVKSLNTKIFGQIESQSDKLTKYQVVQLMYLIGENGHCHRKLLDSLQQLVLENLDSLTLTQLGAVCQGFFKSKTNLKSSLVSGLAKRIHSEQFDSVHSFYLVGILKVLRQAYFGHRSLFGHISQEISPRLPEFPISAIMHVLLTFATLHIHHDRLLEAGSQVLFQRSQECRCKDVSKFLWSFATLNYHPEDSERFFTRLLERMVELLEEYEDFPVFLVSGLLSLAYLNIYPAELLNLVFSPMFLHKIEEYARRSHIDPVRDLFLLHSSVKIECPDYQGNRLSKDFFLRKPLSPKMFGSLQYELSRRPLLAEVSSSLASILGGEQYIKLGFTLPHMKSADIEIHLDSDNNPIAARKFINLAPSSSQLSREKVVPLDPSIINNLSGINIGRLRPPTGNRTASSTPTKIRIASEDEKPQDNREQDTADRRNWNSVESDIPSDGTLAVDRLVLDRAALFAQKKVHPDWSSRFDVPGPLSKDLQGNRLAILIWSRNHFHFNGKKLLGLHSMKKRQLMKLGYKTVDIPFFEWDKLTGSQEREDYIRQKVFPGKLDIKS
ncbi:FAST kinase domain-containing protein 5, mitochondrial-like isoform X2 [Acanthaster planci]|uniref:FAST kinase domain-containing protein 5, mitochondrial-like isoform X2 n=1 Tax=Acanthaster planci TaxID=133434 RepID=A0A8B8A573_ACAPL|nr:FAST kinase domain-containing protein 5, mitochondrial-like isoform X2 [Acanthaster planci]